MLGTVRAMALVATLLILGSVAISAVAEWTGPPQGPLAPLGFSTPTLAVALLDETADTAEEIGAGDPSARAEARRAVHVDYALIAGYWTLFLLLALLLRQRRLPGAGLAAAGVLASVSFAAGADVLENQRLLHVLALSPGDPGWVAALDAVRQAASWRWIGLFVATALAAPVFFGFDDELRWGVGLTFVATGVIGVAGVLWYPPAVAWAIALLATGVIVLAAWGTLAPEQLVESPVPRLG